MALKDIQNNKSLLIKSADKGGAVVIMDAELYRMLNIQLLSHWGEIFLFSTCKDMARNSTLLASSCHPEHVVHNIPVGELIRTKRNCSTDQAFTREQKKVCDRLRSRGYPEWTLSRAKHRVANMSRDILLREKDNTCQKIDGDNSITFSTTYSKQYREIVRIVQTHLPILLAEDKIRDAIGQVCCVSRRAPTLGIIISPSLFIGTNSTQPTWLKTKVFLRCGHRPCTQTVLR